LHSRLPSIAGPGIPHARLSTAGVEWLVDAHGCHPRLLRSRDCLAAIFESVIAGLELRQVEHTLWHEFPEQGGVTGLALLSESHLAVHTFPEWGLATFSFFCCRQCADWPWNDQLRQQLGARSVVVRSVRRGGAAADRAT
jgi:S-adenosylmethionine decarboxylase